MRKLKHLLKQLAQLLSWLPFVASVQAGVAAGRAVLAEAGVLVNAVVISRPHPDVFKELI